MDNKLYKIITLTYLLNTLYFPIIWAAQDKSTTVSKHEENILVCPTIPSEDTNKPVTLGTNKSLPNNKQLTSIKVNALGLKIDIRDANPLFFVGNESALKKNSNIYPSFHGATSVNELNFEELSKQLSLGKKRIGVTSDGVTQLLVILRSPLMGYFSIDVESKNSRNDSAIIGDVEILGDGKTCYTGTEYIGFAIYHAPSDFGRSSGMGPATDWLQPEKHFVEARTVDLHVSLKTQAGERIENSTALKVVRPPVVLVHGAYDSASGAWLTSSKLGDSLPSRNLPSLLEKAGLVPFLVDYQASNGLTGQGDRSSFWNNRYVVWKDADTGWLSEHNTVITNNAEQTGWLSGDNLLPVNTGEKARRGGIRNALNYFREELAIAATQADVIGHSMGGLLARVYASDWDSDTFDEQSTATLKLLDDGNCSDKTPYNPEYKRPDNFEQGDINRLITIGTPHHGSELPEIFHLVTQKAIAKESLRSHFMRKAAFYASWLGAAQSADTATTMELRNNSCALRRIGATQVASHVIAGVTASTGLKDPIYGNLLNDFELMAGLFYFNRELLEELFKIVAKEYEDEKQVNPEWAEKFPDEMLYHFEKLISTEYDKWIEIYDLENPGWMGNSVKKTNYVPYLVIEALRKVIFRFDENDATVRVDSQLAGLKANSPYVTLVADEKDNEIKQSVLHSFEPRYPVIQRKIVKLLWSDSEEYFADSLPPAGQKLPLHAPPDNFGVDLQLEGSFAEKWSGMDFRHTEAFLKVAIEQNVVILSRPVNPDSTELIMRGAATKSMNVKGKSSNWGPQKGYIPVEQRYSKLWRTTFEPDRSIQIDDYNDKTQKLLAAEKSDYQDESGNPIAIGRQLKHKWDVTYSVWMDLKVDDAEQSIFLCKGEPTNPCDCPQWFDWRTNGAVFDLNNAPKATVNPKQCGQLEPLQVLADNTHPDKAFLTADYDILTTGFYCPEGKRSQNEACKALIKVNLDAEKLDKPNCIEGSTKIISADYYKGYPTEQPPCLDAKTGLISKAQELLLEKLNQRVKDSGYTGGNVSHHGPETQFFASPYVDYPITAFDPGLPGKSETTARILSIPKGPKGFRDIHLKRFYEEKIRQGYWLYPNTYGSANWHWEERGSKQDWRGWFYEDSGELRSAKDVDQIPTPACVQVEIERRKDPKRKANKPVDCQQKRPDTASAGDV